METPMSFAQLVGHPPNAVEEKYAPAEIYAGGPAKLPLSDPRVSIVGTRHPSERGISNAKKLAATLVEHNVTIVSGLAAGIDTVAHRTAIEQGGSTIAVLGTPLDRAYPQENRRLQDEIMSKHLAISQFEPRKPITRANFVMRNRTMALLSHVTVIVEAGSKSGTEYQGWEAIRLGRPLFVMDTVDDWPWVEQIFKYGATKYRHTEDVLEYLPSGVALPA